MTWVAVIAMALAAFAIAAFAFRLASGLWTSLAAALMFGLAGYALQASPSVPSAPRASIDDIPAQSALGDVVQARQELIALEDRSEAPQLITGDAMARRGHHDRASTYYAAALAKNPDAFEAWMAQGIALSEHTGGVLTPAALYAFRKANAIEPKNLAPGYFLGLSLIRQGRMMEAREVWRDTLASSGEYAEGREGFALRLARLEDLLGMDGEQAGEFPQVTP